MRHHRFPAWLLLGILLMACNLPLFARAATPTEPGPILVATDTPTVAALASFTPAATNSPPATIVPTPSVPVVTPNAVNVNCRSGPDVAYDSVSVLTFGSSTQVAGRSADSAWWYVRDPGNPSHFCWIFSGVVTIAGPTSGIPVQAPPAAIVTGVTVGVQLPSTVTCDAPNPVSFSGKITTNGEATVKYQWEVTGDQTNTTSPETLEFGEAGTQDAPSPGAYNVNCGRYTITLHVLDPNNMTAQKNFRIAAP
jgi:hypothetical protein